MSTRLRALARAGGRAISRPRWFLEWARLRLDRLRESRRQFSLAPHAHLFADQAEALAAVAAVSQESARAAVATARGTAATLPAVPPGESNPRSELVTVMAALVSLLRPSVVVETGVAHGVTTAAILTAMEQDSHGHLHSVDLPGLARAGDEPVGGGVPEHLRARWTLTLGPSRQVLPSLLDHVKPIDVFLHDADHTYPSQMAEYESAWPALRPGGVLVSDDVANPAFLDFSARVAERPYLIGSPRAGSALGIIRKS